MSEISNLGYLVINVSDLDAWEFFASEILGLMIGERTDDRMTLRMDEYDYRIILNKSDKDDIEVAGWQFDTKEELDQFVDELSQKGVITKQSNDFDRKDRKVEALYYCEDPSGYVHEFFSGPTYAPISRPFRSKVMKGPGFITGRQGFGHILTYAPNQTAIDFYTKTLGLKISDYIRDSETLPGVSVDALFLHTRTGRHHSLATAVVPSEQKLNHFMIEVEDLDDVGLAYDRCIKAGLDLTMSIGHHPNDKVVSFYVRSPSGFSVEYGHGSIVIDDDCWEIKNYSQMSDWGHHRKQVKTFD